MQAGDVLLLENTRFHPGEEANDPALATQMTAMFGLMGQIMPLAAESRILRPPTSVEECHLPEVDPIIDVIKVDPDMIEFGRQCFGDLVGWQGPAGHDPVVARVGLEAPDGGHQDRAAQERRAGRVAGRGEVLPAFGAGSRRFVRRRHRALVVRGRPAGGWARPEATPRAADRNPAGGGAVRDG